MKLKSDQMHQENNIFEILEPNQIPSMDFMIKNEFSNFRNIRKSILLKEFLFKNCHYRINDFSLESVQLEKELGDLYLQLMKSSEILNMDGNVILKS